MKKPIFNKTKSGALRSHLLKVRKTAMLFMSMDNANYLTKQTILKLRNIS